MDPDERRARRRTHTLALDRIPVTSALVDDWLTHLDVRAVGQADYIAPTTRAVHSRNIRRWQAFLIDAAHTDHPDTAAVLAFRTWAAQFRRANTVNALLEAVRLLYRWAAMQGRGAAIGDHVDNLPAQAEPSAPALTEAEFTCALRSIAGDSVAAARDRALLTCLRACPVDTIALVRANISAVDHDHGILHLVPRWRLSQWRRGETACPTEAYPLSPAAGVYLAEYLRLRGQLADSAPLFTAAKTGLRMSALAMRLVVLRTLVAAGLQPASAGLERHRQMFRYPIVTLTDLADLATRVASADGDPLALRAMASLLACAEPLPLERLRLTDFDDVGHLHRPPRGRRPARVIVLSPPIWAEVLPWLQHRRIQNNSPWCFGDATGPLSHHTIKRMAWSLFSDRLPCPARATRGTTASTRRLCPAPGSKA
jgi:site-specific recombinase XerD